MKRLVLVCVIGLLFFLGGVLITDYLGNVRNGDIIIGPPEGFEEPNAKERISRHKRTRVEQLEIEDKILESHKDMVEYVAFAPGSGWLKIKDRDGISPTLSFKHVTHRDIQRFNHFSKSLGLPFRTEFNGNVLRLTMSDSDEKSNLVASTRGTYSYTKVMKKIDFFQPEKPPRVVIHRDQDGKVHLVAVGKPKPEKGPKKKIDVFIAKRDKKEK